MTMPDAQQPVRTGAPLPFARTILGILIFGAVATTAYWVVWFGVDRELLAAAHTESYYAFENAFPLADVWMVLAGILASVSLVRRRASTIVWCSAAGSTSIFLGLLDVLFDLENGIYGSPDHGAVAVELTINVLTIALGAVVVAWALWQRRALMSLG
jgi:hypothetical protein